MIFLTVGTQFPFDRLVKAVDEVCDQKLIYEEIFAQISESKYIPKNFDYVSSLDKSIYDDHFANASTIISHAGMGTISMAMELNKPLLVMPRSARYREVVHDHQFDIAEKFEQAGHILVAWDETQLPERIAALETFIPIPRKARPQVVAKRIREFLDSLTG
jgi:UDP-N-acetylglucosamine transferase subunit ALG13